MFVDIMHSAALIFKGRFFADGQWPPLQEKRTLEFVGAAILSRVTWYTPV